VAGAEPVTTRTVCRAPSRWDSCAVRPVRIGDRKCHQASAGDHERRRVRPDVAVPLGPPSAR